MGFGAKGGPFQARSPCCSRCKKNAKNKKQKIPKMQKKLILIFEI